MKPRQWRKHNNGGDSILKEFKKRKDSYYDDDGVRIDPSPSRQYGASRCLHDGCSKCRGTGVQRNGEACIHMISCPCPKCNPTMQ